MQLVEIPNDLLQFILDFISYYDQLEFISISRSFLLRLKFLIRSLKVYANRIFNQPSVRQKLLPTIDAAKRLKVIIDDEEGCLIFSRFPALHEVEISFMDFAAFLPEFTTPCKIEHLLLCQEEYLDDYDVALPVLDLLEERGSQFGLKELTVSGPDKDIIELSRIPILPDLMAITIKNVELKSGFLFPFQYSRLQRVSLIRCVGLTDVSMLNEVHHLIIASCPDLRDIDALQNNVIIEIKDCFEISDCSNSFCNSKEIVFSTSNPMVNFGNLKRLKKVTALTLQIPLVNQTEVITILPDNLEKLNLKGIQFSATPPHPRSLKSVTLIDSAATLTADGFRNVRILKLVNLLNLTCIKDLGYPGNHYIEIINCPRIEDFSSLRDVPSIKIANCPGFVNIDHVCNTKKLELGLSESHLALHVNVGTLKHLIIPESQDLKDIRILETISTIEMPFHFIYRFTSGCINEKIVLHHPKARSYNQTNARRIELILPFVRDLYHITERTIVRNTESIAPIIEKIVILVRKRS